MKRTCLFLINGLGLGNSTRCHAVMTHLREAGVELHVMTWGNGLAYFADRPGLATVHSMDTFFFSSGESRMSGWRTLFALGRLARMLRLQSEALEKVLQNVRPDLAVIDAEYAIRPLRRRGIPIVGINHTELVVSEYLRHAHNPPSIRGQFWTVEYMDYLFHKHFCDLVLSPSPWPIRVRHPRFRRIGMIVRPDVRAAGAPMTEAGFTAPREVRSCVVMLSGSVFASRIDWGGFNLPFHVDVIGREGRNSERVTYHGRLLHSVHLMRDADMLVVNGSLSSIGDALYLNKPMFVIPLANHAEQYINARMVAEAGRGYVTTQADVVNQIRKVYAANQWTGLSPAVKNLQLGGDHEAAEIMLQMLERPSRA